MAVAGDVPSKYDLVLNGKGYTFLRTMDGSYLSASRHRAEYTSTATFVERQNISNAYGDNSQDFFLTARNRDWSLGEQQKFFRSGQDGRYWMGQNVDVSTPGQVQLSPKLTTSSALSEAVVSGCRAGATVLNVALTGATKLFSIDATGVAAAGVAHGLGAAPARFGMCTDGLKVYMSTTAAGTVGVRSWDGAFATFSATAADSLAFLNNTLFGLVGLNVGAPSLIQYDTAGTATTVFTWKAATGATSISAPVISKIEPFGGKLLILFSFGQDVGAELWIYDGTGASRLEVFPPNFWAYDLEVLYGVAYISGSFFKAAGASTVYGRPAIHFFDGSQVGLVWRANDYGTSALSSTDVGPYPALTVFAGNLVFTDETNGNLMAYDPARGGVSTLATFSTTGDTTRLSTSGTTMVLTRKQTTYSFFPATTHPTSGYVISSLIDFESSLTKQFRGVKVEFAAATDGNGGSVDIAYQVDSLDGSWTTLQTGAVSGTEYTFSNISGHAVAIKVTLNKGTSTAGPVLKSLNVRAAPTLTSFKVRTYNLDLSSDPEHPTRLEDGTDQTLTGFEQAQNLTTAITSTSPISVTDKFGTFTGICEPSACSILELHSQGGGPGTPGQYTAQITVREV